MSVTAQRPRRHYRRSAWVVGAVLFVVIAVAVSWMLRDALRRSAGDEGANRTPAPAGATDGGGAVPELLRTVALNEVGAEKIVRGVVLDPRGRETAAATVTLYRLLTAWPEWRRERIDQAITREDGSFQFACRALHGHLIGFEHENYAGGLREVSLFGETMRLSLRPAFELGGYVLNDLGAPVANATVTLESVPREDRRVQTTVTAADGSYSFRGLPAGPGQLVARHPSWQPAESTALVIGDRRRCDLRFVRPAMSPLAGRVVDASTQRPIAGAEVRLFAINDRPGLADAMLVVTDAGGHFLFDGLPSGSMRLEVRHPEHGFVQRTPSIGPQDFLARRAGTGDDAARELIVEMPRRVPIDGMVYADSVDFPLDAGAVLEFEDASGELYHTELLADGAFAFARPVSPGLGELRVLRGEFSFRRSYARELSVRIAEGDVQELELSVMPSATVSGRCVDDAGDPVAGVRIVRTRLFSESFRHLADAAWDLDVGSFSGSVWRLFDVDREKEIAVTDEHGRFTMQGHRPGPLLGRAIRSGYGSRWLRLTLPALGESRDEGDLVLQPGVRISGRLLRGDTPFGGATVIAVSHECQAVAITDADGSFSIDDLVPGEYTVSARVPGRPVRGGGSSRRVVRVGPGQDQLGVELRLNLGRLVRGRVLDRSGRALPDVVVGARGATAEVRTTDADGRFEIELPREASELVVSLGDRSHRTVVEVGAEQDAIEILLEAPPTCVLQGRVFGLPGRRRLDGALLRLTPVLTGAAAGSMTRWLDMPDGEFERAQVPAGYVRVELWAEGYAPFVVERGLLPNQANSLGDVLLEPGARLRGIVRDPDGNLLAGAAVWLGEQTDLDLFTPTCHTDEKGRFDLQGVTSRSSQLVVRHPAFAAREIRLQLPRDVLSPEPLEVQLAHGATIVVSVPSGVAADAGVVFLRRDGRLLASAALDDDGRAYFANRSAGDYTVSLLGSDAPPIPVRVPATVELVGVDLRR